MNIPPVGVQIPQAATGGLPGGQMPLPPPPKPPLNLQQPPAGNMVSQPIPQPLSSLTTSVPNNTAKAGQIPSLLSLPLGPAKKFSQNSEYFCIVMSRNADVVKPVCFSSQLWSQSVI